MQETLQVLFYWVLVNIGAPPILPLPDVKYVEPAKLAEMYQTHGVGNGVVPEALYIFKEKTIYVPVGFRGETDEEKSTLIHELVHHVQGIIEVDRTNICLIELDAYNIEEEWRKEHGMSTYLDKPWFKFFIGDCTVKWFERVVGKKK